MERESIPFHPLLTSPIPTHPLLLCTGRGPLALISDGSDHSGQGQEPPVKYQVRSRIPRLDVAAAAAAGRGGP